MKHYSLLVVFIIVLAAFHTEALVHNYTDNGNGESSTMQKHECVCPNTTVTAISPEDKRKTTVSVVTAILDTPIPNLTMLGTKFREILRDMLTSSTVSHQQYAALSSNWLSSQLPYLSQRPSGCPMAQLINATATCLANHDGSKMASALDIVATQLSSGASLLISTSIAASGCKSPWSVEEKSSINTVPKYKCFDDGFAYRIRSIWQRLGSDFPDNLKKIVLRMYRSHDYLDNFLAAIATFTLTPSFNNYFVNWPFELAFESVSLQNSGPIPECCCDERLKRINKLANLNTEQTLIQTEAEKNIYSSKWACRVKQNENLNGIGGSTRERSGESGSSSGGGSTASGSSSGGSIAASSSLSGGGSAASGSSSGGGSAASSSLSGGGSSASSSSSVGGSVASGSSSGGGSSVSSSSSGGGSAASGSSSGGSSAASSSSSGGGSAASSSSSGGGSTASSSSSGGVNAASSSSSGGGSAASGSSSGGSGVASSVLAVGGGTKS